MKGSLIIIAFFVLGIVVGLQFSTFNFQFSTFNFQFSTFNFQSSTFILYALMFCVGISIGSDTKTLKSFRGVNPRLMMLPVMTIVGTLAGTAAASALLPHRHLFDCLAIGSGFGYYSLSSIFITQYKGAELGTIALLANILREILTLLCAPLLAKYFGNRGADKYGWSNNNGHHTAHHHLHIRTRLRHCLHLPRLLRRFLRPVPRHVLLFAIR